MKSQLMKTSQPLLFTHLLQRRESLNEKAAVNNLSVKTVILTIMTIHDQEQAEKVMDKPRKSCSCCFLLVISLLVIRLLVISLL